MGLSDPIFILPLQSAFALHHLLVAQTRLISPSAATAWEEQPAWRAQPLPAAVPGRDRPRVRAPPGTGMLSASLRASHTCTYLEEKLSPILCCVFRGSGSARPITGGRDGEVGDEEVQPGLVMGSGACGCSSSPVAPSESPMCSAPSAAGAR